MAISIVNENWSVAEQIVSAQGLSKTLATAGTFVDRNIQITVTPKLGELQLVGATAHDAQQTVVLNSDTNKYNVNVQTQVTLTPKLTEGWINAINLADVTVETTASLDQTTLEAGLTSDNKLYRVSATKGYNGGKTI